ncbi:MAG: anthranilate synthase component I family protein [Thermoleophilia bacterium]|nr:anthranilate synthase component I family protein [Thermoleophilia bacterium]
MIEIHEADGAFEQIEAYLAQAGFPAAGPSLCADVYLGYGLSRTIRRSSAPDPPEPCPLPLAACSVRRVTAACPTPGAFVAGRFEPSWDERAYAAAIDAVHGAIARGDVYQVNLVQHLSAPFRGDVHGLAATLAPLAPLHPRPLVGDGWAIVSASPELFLARRGDRVWTMPIKGTRPVTAADELRSSPKDAAEHVMIVDLERNDLSRLCLAGSVRWPELMAERAMAGVVHLVSTVEGLLRPGTGLAGILAATFPGGSVTGAPKISAVDHIAALEPVGRGASMGALGTVYANGDFDLALTIRTFAIAGDRIHLWVGGGIVWDSDPHEEIEESWVKARPLLAAIGASVREPVSV